MPTLVVDGTNDEAELLGEMTGEPDWEFVESIVADIKRRLDAMGPVNLDAIEEFEELGEHYNLLKDQHDDLDNSQFIIVTHSKRTMARADMMYGVKMEEFGVSKPVGMRLTADDGQGNKTEAKSAAQKAALRLDA